MGRFASIGGLAAMLEGRAGGHRLILTRPAGWLPPTGEHAPWPTVWQMRHRRKNNNYGGFMRVSNPTRRLGLALF